MSQGRKSGNRDSADQVEAHHSTEYLNSINVSGIPLTGFKPNVRCPVMILQNLCPAIALCNGAQAILIHVATHVLEVHLFQGHHARKTAFIPHISLSTPVEAVGFHLSHHQFPV